VFRIITKTMVAACMDWLKGNPRVGLCAVVREEFLPVLEFS